MRNRLDGTMHGRREGDGENPEAAAPSPERPRNSSGSASPAAQLVSLRLKLIELTRLVQMLANASSDTEVETRAKLLLQQGFRSDR